MAGVVYFTASGKLGVWRNNSQVLSGADEWVLVMLVMFITGQYCTINPLKKVVEMWQTWAGNSASWAVPIPAGVIGESRSGTWILGIASSLCSLLKDSAFSPEPGPCELFLPLPAFKQ